jgi:hypothetical protein
VFDPAGCSHGAQKESTLISRLAQTACSLVGLTAIVSLLTIGGCPPTTTGDSNSPSDTNIRPPGIYVANIDNSVLVFSLDAQGDAQPIRKISGPSTELDLPIGLAMDSQSNLYVASRKNSVINVYPGDADGDVAPTKRLTATGMGSPTAIALGLRGDLFVGNCPTCGQGGGGENGVFHFPPNATESDYVIGGASNNNTGFTVPGSVTLDEDSSNPARGAYVIVANSFGGNVAVFAPGIQGDQLPIRTLTPRAGANIQAVAFADNAIFLSVPGAGVDIYPSNALTNAAPSATLGPPDVPVNYPAGIAVDVSVTPPVCYLGDFVGNAIFVIKTAGIAPNLTVDSVRTITGPDTGLNGPTGVLVVK